MDSLADASPPAPQVYMEQVEGLVEQAQAPNDQWVFMSVLWNLH